MTLKISVCMATYNGSKYVKKQLISILKQIGIHDEVIVVDDCSSDSTIEVIKSIDDERIKIITNQKNLGVIGAFECAIANASGEIVFLSDQDDEWLENKVSTILSRFSNSNIDLLQHDAIIVDGFGNVLHKSWARLIDFGPGIFKNFKKNTYVGCCMVFRREVVHKIVPIPRGVQSHDQWIGIMAELCGFRVSFIEDQLIKYVRHGANVSPMIRTRSIFQAIHGRIQFAVAVATHFLKTRN